MLRDLLSMTKNVIHYCKTLTATETPSTGIDVRGMKSVNVLCTVGAITNVANSPQPSWTLALQESDDNSTFTAVGSNDVLLTYGNNDGSISSGVFATIDAADEDDAIYSCGYIGTKRYVRVVATAANTPGATPINVLMSMESEMRPQDDE